MIRKSTLTLFALCPLLASSALWGYTGEFPPATAEFTATTLTVDGLPRNVLVYRPANASNPPLMVLFTGTGGTLDYSLVDELGRGTLQEFADREGVVIAAPLPRLMDRGDWDNHFAGMYYWETAGGEANDSPVSSDPSNNPDLRLAQAVMDEAVRAYGVDSQRIYFNGFSNGAFFSYFAATVLQDRVAAFAETGGGLVLSHTTAGDPPCQPTPTAAAEGAVRSCSESGWTPTTCVSENSQARPIAPGAASRVPPGFLQANDDDTSVPFAHTCNLAHALTGLAEVEARVVHNGGGHIVNADYLDNAWRFMKSRQLGTISPPPVSDADRIFNWAEQQFAHLLNPPGAASQTFQEYYYRHYSGTGAYVGAKGGRIYYLGPATGGAIRDVGSVADFLNQAAQAGY